MSAYANTTASPAVGQEVVVRQVEADDRDALCDLLAGVHRGPDGAPNEAVGRWQRDLFDRGHPTLRPDDMRVAEDRRTGELLSAFIIIPQTWSYGGVPIGVSLLELAATHPDHRGQGLLRRLLDALVEHSAQRGDLLQGMTDVLFFQSDDIGFHPAVTQRAGRGGAARDLPAGPTSGEPVRIRPAAITDLAALADIDRHARERALLSCVRDEIQWLHELCGRSSDSMVHSDVLMVEAPTGPVGYLVLGYGGIPSYPIPHWLPGLPCPEPVVSVSRFELLPGVPWFSVTPSVLRQLTGRLEGYMLWLGTEHPAYDVLGDLLVRRPPHIGWFLRVPDTIALLERIAPVLERRLIGTAAEAFTGDLRLHFYRHGVHLRFGAGSLVAVEPWPEYSRRGSDAALPDQMFLQLLVGHATWEELAPAFPDCRLQTTTARVLLPALFPKQASSIWPLI
jgi:GNAT superfamily N-acetyltransferase